MAKQIVIATHANLSKGFEESLNFIFKPKEKIHTICGFTEAPDPGKAFDELFDTFSEDDTVVVLTDLMGGSVNKQIAERQRDKKFFLVTGLNLAILLEIACCNEADLDADFIRRTIAQGKNEIVFMNDKLNEKANVQDEESFF